MHILLILAIINILYHSFFLHKRKDAVKILLENKTDESAKQPRFF